MLRKLLTFSHYIAFVVSTFILKNSFPLIKINVGGINFYCPKDIHIDLENAIRVELFKYDSEMSNRILTNNIKLTFFYFDRFDYYIPEYGIFFSPKWLSDYGIEGICQYIVYCVIGSDYTGVGLNAAMNISDRKMMLAGCNAAMTRWIKEKNFPEKWLSSYMPKDERGDMLFHDKE
jgi:hypothetical protein